MSPLKSPNDSLEVSCEEKDVDTVVTGDRDVLASELPASDMEAAPLPPPLEVSEDTSRSEDVGEWRLGVNPAWEKYGCSRLLPAEIRSSEENTSMALKFKLN